MELEMNQKNAAHKDDKHLWYIFSVKAHEFVNSLVET